MAATPAAPAPPHTPVASARKVKGARPPPARRTPPGRAPTRRPASRPQARGQHLSGGEGKEPDDVRPEDMVNVWEETLEALGTSANLFREDFGPTSESLAHDISREMAMYPDIPELDLDADLQGGAFAWEGERPGRSPKRTTPRGKAFTANPKSRELAKHRFTRAGLSDREQREFYAHMMHEEAMLKKILKEQNALVRRQEKELLETQGLTFSPTISKKASAITRGPNQSIHHRSALLRQLRELKLKEARMQQAQEELEECPFQPRLVSNYKFKSKKYLQQGFASMSFMERVELAENHRNLKVEEKRRLLMGSQMRSTPSVNRGHRPPDSDVSIHERLYQMAKERATPMTPEGRMEGQFEATKVMYTTGRPLSAWELGLRSSPRRPRTAETPRKPAYGADLSTAELDSSLYLDHFLRKTKGEEMVKKAEEGWKALSNSPKVTPRSLKYASERFKRQIQRAFRERAGKGVCRGVEQLEKILEDLTILQTVESYARNHATRFGRPTEEKEILHALWSHLCGSDANGVTLHTLTEFLAVVDDLAVPGGQPPSEDDDRVSIFDEGEKETMRATYDLARQVLRLKQANFSYFTKIKPEASTLVRTESKSFQPQGSANAHQRYEKSPEVQQWVQQERERARRMEMEGCTFTPTVHDLPKDHTPSEAILPPARRKSLIPTRKPKTPLTSPRSPRRKSETATIDLTGSVALYIDIKLAPGLVSRVGISTGEDPAELARQFCAKHTLDAGVEAVVQLAIEEKMRSYGL